MSDNFLDTSAAIPLVVAGHEAHRVVTHHVGGRVVRLPAHAMLESYSVLTRLPGDSRLAPGDAATLLAGRFASPACPSSETWMALVARLADHGIAGGAVYDALIAATAIEWGAVLLTRDRRAIATYGELGAEFELIAGT